MPETTASGSVFPHEPLDAMYPDIYYRVYPMVKQMCEMYDTPSNPGFYPYPSRTSVAQMSEQICQRVMRDMGESFNPDGRRGFLRSLVLILLIRELLRRRGSI